MTKTFYGVEVGPGIIYDPSEGKTRQSEVDQADINKILRRFEKSGILPLVDREGYFMDVSELGDFREHLDKINRATTYFDGLPADVRSQYGNDVTNFVEALNDPANRNTFIELGIIEGEITKDVSSDGAGAPPAGAAP